MYTSIEGHAYRLLFGLVLEDIQDRGFHDRMDPIPRPATDVARFHSIHAAPFHSSCEPPWRTMTDDQKIKRLKAWMCTKFIPRPTSRNSEGPAKMRRADVGWNTFHMTEDEINDVADSAFSTYRREAEYFDLGLPSYMWNEVDRSIGMRSSAGPMGCPDGHKT